MLVNSSELSLSRYDTAPKLCERKKIDLDNIAKTRESNNQENWSIGDGDYFYPFSDKQKLVIPPRKNITELLGTEIILHNLMKKMIENHDHRNNDNPVVFLDFGGMWGVSWCRLVTKFSNEILSNKACFVVSNIKLNPQTSLPDTYNYDEGTVSLIKENRHLISFINCDATELKSMPPVISKRGDKISLYGHLSLIHENLALAHTSVPDMDLPTLGECLEPGGVLMFTSNSMHSSDNEREKLKEEINRSFEVGISNLAQMGFNNQNIENRCGYSIYSKQSSSQLFT